LPRVAREFCSRAVARNPPFPLAGHTQREEETHMDTRSRQEALTALSVALDLAGDCLEELSPEDLGDEGLYRWLDETITEAANRVAGLREYPQEW
jgi:hypothetical protein